MKTVVLDKMRGEKNVWTIFGSGVRKKTRARPRVRVQFVNKYQKTSTKKKKLAE